MWRYRVDDNQVIDADTGKALTLLEISKLLNVGATLKEKSREALDLVDNAIVKLRNFEDVISLLEEASKPLDSLGWGGR